MFNIGVGELLVVLVVAFVIVGPDDLPRVARWLGRQVRKLRMLIRDIKAETGWDELEKEVSDVRRDVRQTARELDISADLRDAVKDVKGELNDVSKGVKADLKQIDRDVKRDIREMDDEVRSAANNPADVAAKQ